MGEGFVSQLLTGVGTKYAGIGLILYTAYRAVTFVFEFSASRHDARQKRLDDQEERVDASLEARLRHLERQEMLNRKAILALEKLVRLLATEVARLEPNNPKLADVASVLSRAYSVDFDVPPDMARRLDDTQ